MFKITPIQNEELQKKYAKECGCDFCPSFFAYSMLDNDSGELMGFSQFEVCESGGYINDLRTRIGYSDFEAMFILGRATMNFIDLCGAHTCTAKADAGDERLMRAIGFSPREDGLLFADMSGMFDGHCDGKEKTLK